MREVLSAVVVVVLLACPALGALEVKLTADKTSLPLGEQTLVWIFARDAQNGVTHLAGDVAASGDPFTLGSVLGSFAFAPAFAGNPFLPAQPGYPGENGGWQDFAGSQSSFPPVGDLGKTAWVQVASYRVQGLAEGPVTLSFAGQAMPWEPPFAPVEPTLGTMTPVTIQVVTPEPLTLLLLGTAGALAALRRRRR